MACFNHSATRLSSRSKQHKPNSFRYAHTQHLAVSQEVAARSVQGARNGSPHDRALTTLPYLLNRAMREFFRRFAHLTSEVVGSAWAFIVACLVIVVWAATGPMFNWSDTWQLVINTGTTIITFLMVFLIQNMQNLDAKAIHL